MSQFIADMKDNLRMRHVNDVVKRLQQIANRLASEKSCKESCFESELMKNFEGAFPVKVKVEHWHMLIHFIYTSMRKIQEPK